MSVQMVQMIGRDRIVPSVTNPRKHFDPVRLEELAATLKADGVLSPLLVRKLSARGPIEAQLYELVAGERRWRASELAGLNELPCIVRELSDKDVLRLQYIENMQREDLTPLEESEGFAKLIAEKIFTPETLAAELGKSRSHIFSRLKLARLEGYARQELEHGNIPATVAALAGQLPTAKLQKQFVSEVLRGDWDNHTEKREPLSFRAAEHLLEEEYVRRLNGAFSLEADLVKGCGPCTTCKKRSGNLPGFAGGNPNVCTDVECFAAKEKAHGENLLKAAAAEGKKVVKAKDLQSWEIDRKFPKPGATSYEDGMDGKSFEQLLKKELPRILVNTKEGVTERVDLDAARALMREKGLLKKERRNELSAAEKRRRDQDKIEKAVNEALIGELVRTAEVQVMTTEVWRILTRGAVGLAGHYRLEPLMKRRALKEKGVHSYENAERFGAAVQGYTKEQCAGVLVELLAGHDEDDMNALAKLWKVDLKAVERETKEQLAQGKKAKDKTPVRAEQNAKVAKWREKNGVRLEQEGLKGSFARGPVNVSVGALDHATRAKLANEARQRWAEARAGKPAAAHA